MRRRRLIKFCALVVLTLIVVGNLYFVGNVPRTIVSENSEAEYDSPTKKAPNDVYEQMKMYYKITDEHVTSQKSTGLNISEAFTHRGFVYHALMKTGSSRIRIPMRLICLKNDWKCFDVLNPKQMCMIDHKCHVKRALEHDGFPEIRYNGTAKQYNETAIPYGQMTVYRMKHCCERAWKTNSLRGVIDHLTLAVPDNRLYISNRLPVDALRLTVMREPMAQFISFHAYLKNLNTTNRDIAGSRVDRVLQNVFIALPDTIDLYHRIYSGIQPDHRNMYEFLTNSQSKELGWNGKTEWNLAIVESYVRNLAFVGLTEHLNKVMMDLNLQVPNYKDNISKSADTARQLSAEHRRKLREIQWADLRLYEVAKELWQQQQIRAKSS